MPAPFQKICFLITASLVLHVALSEVISAVLRQLHPRQNLSSFPRLFSFNLIHPFCSLVYKLQSQLLSMEL